MKKYISYEKLSKKAKKQQDRLRRGSWGGINPITRCSKNKTKYNRKAAQVWKKESDYVPLIIMDTSEKYIRQEVYCRGGAMAIIGSGSIRRWSDTGQTGTIKDRA